MSDRLDDDIRERVRARMERDFVSPGEPLDPKQMAWAESRLRDALEREMGPPAGEARAASPQAAPRGARAESGLDEVIRAILGAAWKPAIAVVVLVVGTWTYGVMLEKKEVTPRMRGTVVPPAGTAELSIGAPVVGKDGSLHLAWSPAKEADRYAVVFQAPDLSEIGRMADVTGTTLELSTGALPADLPRGATVLVHVVAMRGADEIARSKPVEVTLPK